MFFRKFKVVSAADDNAGQTAGDAAGDAVAARPLKRRKVSAGGFFDDGDDDEEDADAPDAAVKDELAEYLALPQMKFKTDYELLDWWRSRRVDFPNLEVMARQYLGCPATSASVERLFSCVGIAFSNKRKSSHASTMKDMMFAHANL